LGPHLIQAGAREFWSFLATGNLHRPDTLMVFFAAIAHIVLLIGCLAAFRGLHPGKKEWWRFLTGGVLVLAYFAIIVVAFLPR
jgi:type VI protein secretion system component VasK